MIIKQLEANGRRLSILENDGEYSVECEQSTKSSPVYYWYECDTYTKAIRLFNRHVKWVKGGRLPMLEATILL